MITRIIVHGRVQGVGYRYWTMSTARRHKLEGWVRNRQDGTVEAVLSGPAAVIAEMIEECRQGPRSARVDRIDEHAADESELALRGAGEAFAQLPTV